MRSTSLLAKSWWHKVLAQACRSGSVAPASVYLILVLQSPMLVLLPLLGAGKEKISILTLGHTQRTSCYSGSQSMSRMAALDSLPLKHPKIVCSQGTLKLTIPSRAYWRLSAICFVSVWIQSCSCLGCCFPVCSVFLFYLLPRVVLALKYHVRACQHLRSETCGGFWAATFTFGRSPVPAPVGRSPLSGFADVIHKSSRSSSLPWRHKLTLPGSSAFLASEWTEIQWLNLSSHGRHSLNLHYGLLFLSLIFIPAKLCLCVCVFVHMRVRVFMLHRHMWYVFIYVCIQCMHTW